MKSGFASRPRPRGVSMIIGCDRDDSADRGFQTQRTRDSPTVRVFLYSCACVCVCVGYAC